MKPLIVSLPSDPLFVIYSGYIMEFSRNKASEIHLPLSRERLQAFETLQIPFVEENARDKERAIKLFKEKIDLGNEKGLEHLYMTFSLEDINRNIIPKINIKNAILSHNDIESETTNLLLTCNLKDFREFYKETELRDIAEPIMKEIIRHCISFADYKCEEENNK